MKTKQEWRERTVNVNNMLQDTALKTICGSNLEPATWTPRSSGWCSPPFFCSIERQNTKEIKTRRRINQRRTHYGTLTSTCN